MQPPEDPLRLLDEPGDGEADLRTALRGMQARLPSEARLAAMAANVGLAPEASPPHGDAGTSGAGAISAKGAALLAGGAAAVAIAILSLRQPEVVPYRDAAPIPSVAPIAAPPLDDPGEPFARERRLGTPRSSDEDREPPAAAAAETPPAEPSPVTAAPSGHHAREGRSPEHAPAVARSSESQAVSRSGAHSAAPDSRPTGSPPADPAAGAAAPSEASLLADARGALESDPARALALTEAHRRTYPRSGFAQERELLAITALVRTGRSGDAAARAERFRSSYPASPYLKRIDRLTGK